MKTSIIITPPSLEPVTLAEAKAQLRILGSDTTYDTEIATDITAARQWIEQRYGISIITQTRQQNQDSFWDYYPIQRNFLGPYYSRFTINLLSPPVQSIVSLQYYDVNQNLQTLVEGTDFFAQGKMTPVKGSLSVEICRLWPPNSWPAFKWFPDAIKIQYVAGFGNDSTFCPEPIRTSIKMAISHFFENRMEEITGERIAKFEMSIDRVMAGFEMFQHVTIYA